MINYSLEHLFNEDSVKKDIIIDYGIGQITNKDIYQESFSLSESLNSDTQLRFGSCEASKVSFSIRNNGIVALKDMMITISIVLDNNFENPFVLGNYTVYSDTLSKDRRKRDIVAYDAMYEIINADVIDWWKSLSFPITIKNLRTSLLNYFGIEQQEIALVNDGAYIYNSQSEEDRLSGRTVLNAICEINGVFGHINRSGVFTYVSLGNASSGIYPTFDLFPGEMVFPGTYSENVEIPRSRYKELFYENYTAKKIDTLEIRKENGSIGASAGSSNYNARSMSIPNVYIVQNDIITYGQSESQLQTMATNMLNKVENVAYVPSDAEVKGNPCHEVGDSVAFLSDDGSYVDTYILTRKLSGIQALKDTYTADGVERYSQEVNKVDKNIQSLNFKTADLSRRLFNLEQGGQAIPIVSVPSLTGNEEYGVVYLVQGTVVVE